MTRKIALIAREHVKERVNSWGRTKERSAPKRAAL